LEPVFGIMPVKQGPSRVRMAIENAHRD